MYDNDTNVMRQGGSCDQRAYVALTTSYIAQQHASKVSMSTWQKWRHTYRHHVSHHILAQMHD